MALAGDCVVTAAHRKYVYNKRNRQTLHCRMKIRISDFQSDPVRSDKTDGWTHHMHLKRITNTSQTNWVHVVNADKQHSQIQLTMLHNIADRIVGLGFIIDAITSIIKNTINLNVQSDPVRYDKTEGWTHHMHLCHHVRSGPV